MTRRREAETAPLARPAWNLLVLGTVKGDANTLGVAHVPVMVESPENTVDHSELRLQVPATADHLRTVRLVAADAAERAGFDCDDTDDLRIAVDELCHAVMTITDAPILLGFAVHGGLVEVRGAAERDGAEGAYHLSPLSELIVDAVSDTYELVDGPSDVRFVLRKHAFEPSTR